MARYLITGGSGFIGQALCRRWLAQGHQIWAYTRDPNKLRKLFRESVEAEQLVPFHEWQDVKSDTVFDAAVNLAGAGIADKRWSAQRKRQLVESRVHTTRDLVKTIKGLDQPVPILISGSATGYYGHKADFDVVEETTPIKGFSWSLCERWEQMALHAQSDDTRVCILRLGVVLGASGGLFQKMKLPYSLGLGGPMGDGQHWFSWIHLDDVLGIIDHLMKHKDLSGVFNAVSPEPLRQADFSKQLAGAFRRRDPFRIPDWGLKLLLGELAELLLSSQRAFPERLRGAGYEFKYRQLGPALEDLIPQAKGTQPIPNEESKV